MGPFERMGISSHNDLGSFQVGSPAECGARCLRNPDCRSFDYGARDRVTGECWLSTATRASAAEGAYESWPSYDYYERDLGQEEAQVTAAAAGSGEDVDDDDDDDVLSYAYWIGGLVVALAVGVALGVVIVLRCRRLKTDSGITPGDAVSARHGTVVMSPTGAGPVVVGQPIPGQAPPPAAAKRDSGSRSASSNGTRSGAPGPPASYIERKASTSKARTSRGGRYKAAESPLAGA